VKVTFKIIAMACGLTLAAASHAAPPAGAPADSTGLCKDGSYYTGAEKKGACKGHKGVKDWWGKEGATPGKDAKAAPKASETTAAAAPAKPAGDKVAAAGGGAGKVWVNTESKVYHCQGDKWYGKTKQGEYMSEADATSKGFRADHGKACK
jgi:hypothetical protein